MTCGQKLPGTKPRPGSPSWLAAVAGAALCLALLSASPAGAAAQATETDDFMRHIVGQPGVTTLSDGLAYKILQSGDPTGTPPVLGDELVLNYEGKLPDGATFDSTDQQGGMARLPYDGLIAGWMEALKMMRPGDIWMLYVPAKLGYGAHGQGPIPPNSPLVFKIELVAVHHG